MLNAGRTPRRGVTTAQARKKDTGATVDQRTILRAQVGDTVGMKGAQQPRLKIAGRITCGIAQQAQAAGFHGQMGPMVTITGGTLRVAAAAAEVVIIIAGEIMQWTDTEVVAPAVAVQVRPAVVEVVVETILLTSMVPRK